jgi:peptidoglycan hydrolase-like protein with peptidoglycan-binding domain
MTDPKEFGEWVQMRLTAHGFPVGQIDGIVGPTTQKAIRAFEARHDLPINGTADSRVVRALKARVVASPSEMADIPDRDAPEVVIALPAVKTRNLWPRQNSVPSYYGTKGKNQTSIEVPFDMFLAWDKSDRVRRITLHKKVAASAARVFQTIAATYSVQERRDIGINLFGGSLNVRKMRGGSAWSMHSWGIAIDFDPERNQLKWGAPKARLSRPDAIAFWQAWEAEGWLSLGRAKNYDWMHVQAARL